MPAVVTDQFRILNASNFVDRVTGVGVTDPSSSFYVSVSLPNPTIVGFGRTSTWNTATPNPVDNILQISGNRESYNIEIYSLTGQKLYTAFNISNVDMSPYANGIYIIKVYHGNSLTIKRIIKSN